MTIDKSDKIRQQSMEQYGFGPNAMKKLKVCDKCKVPTNSDEQFCSRCGERLTNKTLYDLYREKHNICPACDTVLSDKMHYCPQCGMKLSFNPNNGKQE